MENERKSSGINIGSASIIMVFSVLCLTVFAVLTYITANSEYKLAVKSSDTVEAYYVADTSACEKVATLKSSENLQTASEELGAKYETVDGSPVVSFEEKIDDIRSLSVKISKTGDKIEIMEWKTVSNAEWTPDDNIKLWDGVF